MSRKDASQVAIGVMASAREEVAKALDALLKRDFPQSRGRETRVEAYLALNALLQVEDSPASVRALRVALPTLLDEFRRDLELATARDVVHACLRTLSYFMYHRAMADAFPENQTSFFLSEIVRLLFSTQDEATYKLCLWCLSMQNFSSSRHRLLPRTVEGLVQAIINPFKSRPIELQALQGLYSLMLKYPEQMAVSPTILGVWVKPISSRLLSSDRATRDQARILLLEASQYQHKWTSDVAAHVQSCVGEYVLPAMKKLVDRDKHIEALSIWSLTITLMQSALVDDLTVLNAVLYVPENAMGHSDAAVRLMAIQAWSHLVDAFCSTDHWLFKKSVVQLLVQPVVVALEVEPLRNIVHAAYLCWKKLVGAAVNAFNVHYHEVASIEGAQQDSTKWNRWIEELIRIPISTIMLSRSQLQASYGANDTGNEERAEFITMAASIWSTSDLNSVEANISLLKEQLTQTKDCPGIKVETPASKDCVIGSSAIGLAFLLTDIFSLIQALISTSEAAEVSAVVKHQARDLVGATWAGFCKRIWKSVTKPDKLRLRLARLCSDFAIGASSSVSSTFQLSIDWQVVLLEQVLSAAPSNEVIASLLLHPKSKISGAIVSRLTSMQGSHTACSSIIRRFFTPEKNPPENLLSLTHRKNVALMLMLDMLLESAIAIDAKNNPSLSEAVGMSVHVCKLCELLVSAVKGVHGKVSESQAWNNVLGFIERCVNAAQILVKAEQDGQVDSQVWDGFVALCMSASNAESSGSVIVISSSVESPQPAKDEVVEESATHPDAISNITHLEDLPSSSMANTSNFVVDEAVSHNAIDLECLVRGPMTTQKSSASGNSSYASTTISDHEAAAPCSPILSARPRREESTEVAPPAMVSAKIPEPDAEQSPARIQSTSEVISALKVTPTKRGLPVSSEMPNAVAGPNEPIYPPLVSCLDSISLIYRHFPLAFRPFFSFYKIKTVGDLSSTTTAKVKTFGIKDPVETVIRALSDYETRKNRAVGAVNSPLKQKIPLTPSRKTSGTGSAPATPISSRASPSPRRSALSKRQAGRMVHNGVSPLQLDSPGRKRARRSLEELNSEMGDQTPKAVDPKLADRVTFQLPTGEGDTTRITRPGEASQEQPHKIQDLDSDDKMSQYMLKLLQHLRRSAYYVEKLAAEEESLQSESSLHTDAANMRQVLADYQEAHQLVETLSGQLHIVADTSARRCRRLLDRAGAENCATKPS